MRFVLVGCFRSAQEDLFDDQYIKCMSQLQPEESPASQETLEVNDLAANVRKSHGKQLKKAVKAAISKMRASSKEVVDQEKVSQKRRSHKVEKLSEKEKADRKVERVARKEKFCRKNGGICDNSKRSKIRCNEDDMAEMRKSFKVSVAWLVSLSPLIEKRLLPSPYHSACSWVTHHITE